MKIEPYKGIAQIYEEIRPSYPEQLIQDIIHKTRLLPDDRLLEIGAGTGKATVLFAEKGYSIHAIELGQDMADIFKKKCSGYPGVTIDVGPFEEWTDQKNRKYDMIFSAQAFDWLDKDRKYRKCHALLKDHGFMALFWYRPSNDKLPITIEIDRQVNRIIDKYIAEYYSDGGKVDRITRQDQPVQNGVMDSRQIEIEESGLFQLVDKSEYTYAERDNASQYIKALKSVPAYAAILDGIVDKLVVRMDREIEQVIQSFGGYVDVVFHYTLYIAQKL